MVTGERRTGTADDAAAARDNGTVLRSEQSASKKVWSNITREPVERSVAITAMSGPAPRLRSAKVAPWNKISSYNWAASSDRPQPVDDKAGQFVGFSPREINSPCTLRVKKAFSFSWKSLSP